MRGQPLTRALVTMLGLIWCAACTNGQTGSKMDPGPGSPTPGPTRRGGCPAPLDDSAEITFGCVQSQPPLVKTTGPCGVTISDAGTGFSVRAHDTGNCHLDLTFGSGATSFADVNFMARWRALGDDPRGCGQEFVPVDDAGNPCLGECGFLVPAPQCKAPIDELDGGF